MFTCITVLEAGGEVLFVVRVAGGAVGVAGSRAGPAVSVTSQTRARAVVETWLTLTVAGELAQSLPCPLPAQAAVRTLTHVFSARVTSCGTPDTLAPVH